jgi:hypothetical protein
VLEALDGEERDDECGEASLVSSWYNCARCAGEADGHLFSRCSAEPQV